MKRRVGLFVLLIAQLLTASVIAQESTARRDNKLRMMSYNVRNGIGLDEKRDYQRVAEVINSNHPDVVALQELDSVTGRSQQVDVLAVLAKETQMHAAFAKAIDYDGGGYGIGILSKERPINKGSFQLPGREEQRAFIWVEFDKYIFCCAHFSLTEEDRLNSLEIIEAWSRNKSKPIFLAGDLNDEPASQTINLIKENAVILSNTSKNTFPANKPDRCIDYIIGTKQHGSLYTHLNSFVVNEPMASDHRPLVVDIVWKQPVTQLFRTNPYLQNPVNNGITIMWSTQVPTHSWVEYGVDPSKLTAVQPLIDGQVLSNNLQHKIRLNNLQTGTTYYYKVCSREITNYQAYHKEFGETAVSEIATFKLPDASQADFTAIIFNDLHKQDETLKALHRHVKDIPYDFVVFNGDCVDDPANAAEAIRYISVCNDIVGANKVPVFYMRGNHEIRNAFSIGLRDLYDYVGDKTYGAFSWGDTRIVMLDCGEDKPDDHWVYYGLNDFSGLRQEQVSFLQQELSSKSFKKASKKLLLHHIPIYGAPDEYNPCLALWDPLLKKAPFSLAVNGHMHAYSFHPKGSGGNNFPVVVGGGPSIQNATVMILQKKGKDLFLKVCNAAGDNLLELTL